MVRRVLVACEESQAVTIALRERGVEAFSCDIQECSGGHPEWHIQDDVLKVVEDKWLAVIAFPPCTHLASSGAAWFAKKREDGRQQRGIDFFMKFATLDHIPYVSIENPVGIMSKQWRKPDQYIQPYEFGHPTSKKTCLWLKRLPELTPTSIVEVEYYTYPGGKRVPVWEAQCANIPYKDRGKARSKTFSGIASAMADQWSPLLTEKVYA